jgi:glutathione S-transferase
MEKDHGIVLYHAPLAVCAAKVRMTLAEKGLAWDSVVVDLAAGEQFSSAYRSVHPGAVVPALGHGDRMILDSTVINEYLDDAFERTRLRPAHPFDRSRMRWWTKQEDEIQVVINTLVTALVLRPLQRAHDDATPVARHLDPDRRERWESLMSQGVASPFVDRALRRLARCLSDMDASLREADYLAGDAFSLADIGQAPYLNALTLLQLGDLWIDRPAIEAWRLRIGARPSFVAGVTSFVSQRAEDVWARGGSQHRLEIEERFRRAAELMKGM